MEIKRRKAAGKKEALRKITMIRQIYGARYFLERHCQWRIGGRGACCLPRCLRGLKYKGRNEDENRL